MKFVLLSYHYSADIKKPEDWYDRVSMYTGSWEQLTKAHEIIRIDQINYTGEHIHNGILYYFMRYGQRKMLFPWRLHEFVSGLDPDIVLVNGLHHPLQILQLRMKLPTKTKIIAQHHAEKPFTGIKKYWQRWASRSVDAYLFASHTVGEDWFRKGNISAVRKIHEVMEVSTAFQPIDRLFARSITKASGNSIYLWVGRLNSNKDPLTVIKAFLGFLDFNPASRLYMIYQSDELLMAVRELIPEEHRYRIILVGKVQHADLLYWYSSADFFISASHYEGSGTAVCESMSCACIPILTNIESFNMMTNDGYCGLLFEKGDQEGLLSRLLESVSIDKCTFQKRALENFHQKLSFEAIAQAIQRIAVSL